MVYLRHIKKTGIDGHTERKMKFRDEIMEGLGASVQI